MTPVARGSGDREPMLLSRRWMQIALLVFIAGFFVLGLAGYRTYTGEPPIPEQRRRPRRPTVFTHDDVMAGQEVFLSNGLMEYGSIFGHGAYLGPDFTADYLHRSSQRCDAVYRGGERHPVGAA